MIENTKKNIRRISQRTHEFKLNFLKNKKMYLKMHVQKLVILDDTRDDSFELSLNL